jgi:transcriptional regulator with XRE-family HTH domain
VVHERGGYLPFCYRPRPKETPPRACVGILTKRQGDVNPVNNEQDELSSSAHRFGERLRKIRERQELKQSDLARRSGLTPAAISQLESGQREPNFSTIIRLANALGTTPNDLLDMGAEISGDPSIQALFREVSKLEREDFDAVKAFAQFLAQKKK